MLKLRGLPFAKRLLAATLFSGACIVGAAAEDAHVKEIKFEIVAPWQSEINVTSSDNAKWDTILPNNLTVWAHMKVDTRWPGYVERVGIFLGHCHNTQCGAFPILFEDTVLERDYNHQTYFDFSAATLPVSGGGGIPAVPYGDQILAECNKHLQPDGPTKPHSFNATMTASFSVNTRKAVFRKFFSPIEAGSEFNGGDHTRHADFTVKVNCIPVPSHVSEAPPRRHHVTVEDIKLFLTTYAAQAPAGRAPGAAQCKPLKVTTRIATDKEGPVKVRLWRKIDNGPPTDEVRTLDAKALGGDKFGADWDKWEHFGKTTYAQYMAEIIGGTFAPSTPWKDITIHCAGNLANAPRPGDGPINVPDPKRPGLIDPPKTIGPKVSCAGGMVKGSDCVCPGGTQEIKVGANAYRCTQKKVQSTKTAPVTPQRKLVVPPRQRTTGATTGQRVIR